MKNILTKHPLTFYLLYSLYTLLFLSFSRLVLALWLFDRVDAVNGWGSVLLQGVRVDIATLCLLLIIPMIYSLVIPDRGERWTFDKRIIQVWLTLIAVSFVFMELATPSFIQEYNVRPNRLFFEYLIYPKEVFGMQIKSKLPELLNSSVLTSLTGYSVWKWVASNIHHRNSVPVKWRPFALVVILLLSALGVRSTLGNQPLNPSMVYFSNDPCVNSLTLNSFYSVLLSTKQILNQEPSNNRPHHPTKTHTQ
jgi:phosphoglycerol transferase MdoB-like AlkP superfamily enzyme